MCESGAPCSNNSGGPWPPMTPLIVAPDVWILKVLNPGMNGLVPPVAGCCAAKDGIRLTANPAAATAACLKRSRLPGLNSERLAMIEAPVEDSVFGYCPNPGGGFQYFRLRLSANLAVRRSLRNSSFSCIHDAS